MDMLLLSHPMGQTRGFAHYQYYYTHRRPRLVHNREQERDHPNTGSFSIEDLPKDVIFRKNEITLIRGLSLLIGVRIRNSPSKITRARGLSSMELVPEGVLAPGFGLIFASLLGRTEMTWRITIAVTSASDRLELIETSAETVRRISPSVASWSDRLDKPFASQDSCCRNEVTEISVILWSEPLVDTLHCRGHLLLCSGRWSSHGQT